MPGMGNGRRARVLTCSAIMLTVVTGVAGCGGKTSAGGSSTATSTSVTASSTSAASPTSTSSSVSSTPTAPATGNPALGITGLPDAAKQKTTDGAIAFVKYYVSVINEAYQFMKPGLLEPMALASCKTCDLWEQSVVDYTAKEQHTDGPIYRSGGEYYIAANLLNATPPEVHVGTKFPPTAVRLIDQGGQVVKSESVEKPEMVFLVEWTDDGWRVQKAQDGSA